VSSCAGGRGVGSFATLCSVLQCVACVAVCCSVSTCGCVIRERVCHLVQVGGMWGALLKCVAACCSVLRCVAVCCSASTCDCVVREWVCQCCSVL